MKASDYIASVLEEKKVPAVFELIGGMITHILDSVSVRGRTNLVSMHHEQGAAFAAEAVGRITGIPGVAMGTSGPGATNLLTGIGSCYFDSSPAVFITGQVNRHEQKGERSVRQLGFQETDIVSMARPITKKASLVNDPRQLPNALEEGFQLAIRGRPGPVLIDIPMDVQRENVEPAWMTENFVNADSIPDEKLLLEVREGLLKARKPLILAGGGVRSGGAFAAFRKFVDAARVPVVHSLMGVDLLPSNHFLNVGLIGSYGNRWANLALANCDFLLVIGSRLDVRQTGADTAGFKEGREIYHIDCEPGEINNRVIGCHAIISEIRPLLSVLTEILEPVGPTLAENVNSWLADIETLRRSWPDTDELKGIEGINPNRLMHCLSRGNRDVAAYVVDVGQHQMWAAQSLELLDGQRFLTSGGMGAMGFALPAAIGASCSASSDNRSRSWPEMGASSVISRNCRQSLVWGCPFAWSLSTIVVWAWSGNFRNRISRAATNRQYGAIPHPISSALLRDLGFLPGPSPIPPSWMPVLPGCTRTTMVLLCFRSWCL